jgi:hypothetical protein
LQAFLLDSNQPVYVFAESLILALFGKKKFFMRSKPSPSNFAYKKIKIFNIFLLTALKKKSINLLIFNYL